MARRCCALRRERGSGRLDLDVALEVAAGRCLALAGPSGAGKTSILRVVAGLLRPSAGRVACGERGVAGHRPRHRPPARAPPLRLRLPGVRAVRAPARLAERRLPAARACRGAAAAARPGAARALRPRRAAPTRARARCRAASASAWRWPARSRASRARCCSTSRCRRSTRAPARPRAASWPAVLREAGVPALLVTHDFTEAALLGDEVGGRSTAGGSSSAATPAELAAQPASAFVADFTGAVVLTGIAHPVAGRRDAGRARRRRHRHRRSTGGRARWR